MGERIQKSLQNSLEDPEKIKGGLDRYSLQKINLPE